MIIEKTVVGELGTNCYFAGAPGELLVIDPGANAELLYSKILKNGYKVKYILLTHCHCDHIGATEKLRELTGAKIGVFSGDKDAFSNPDANLSAYFSEKLTLSPPDFTFTEGDVLTSGEFAFKVIHTPGHTSGSVCFLCDKHLFCGDTLFRLSYGRYDFPTGSLSDIIYSINEKLFALEDDVLCYPGHGENTTIGFEKRENVISEMSEMFDGNRL